MVASRWTSFACATKIRGMGKKGKGKGKGSRRRHETPGRHPSPTPRGSPGNPDEPSSLAPARRRAGRRRPRSRPASTRAAVHLLRRLHREDAALGVSSTRLSALSVLVLGGPRTLGQLADAEGVTAPSMTRLVTAMEADGLVERTRSETTAGWSSSARRTGARSCSTAAATSAWRCSRACVRELPDDDQRRLDAASGHPGGPAPAGAPVVTRREPWRLAGRSRASLERDLAVWLGLFTAALLTMGVGTPPMGIVAALIACVATLAVCSAGTCRGWPSCVLVVVGVYLRVTAVYGGFSDVLQVVPGRRPARARGRQPVRHRLSGVVPARAPPTRTGRSRSPGTCPRWTHPRAFELLVACGMVVILGIRGRVLGLAIYAVLAPLLVTAADGSNDTSAGVAAAHRAAGGAALARSRAASCWRWPPRFKPYAAAWLPPLLAYGGIVWPLLAFVAGQPGDVGLRRSCWWRPAPSSTASARPTAVHATPYYSLGWVTGRRQRDARVGVAAAAPGARRGRGRSWASSR